MRWRDGDRQPHHRLAAHRGLGGWATGPHDDPPRAFDSAGIEFAHLGGFALACSSDLRWVLLAGSMQPHHSGGVVLLWGTGPDASCCVLVTGDDYYGETHTALFSPDSSTVVAALEQDCLEAWPTAWEVNGHWAWRWCVTQNPFDEDGEEPDELENVGLATSGDGKLIVATSRRDGAVDVYSMADGEPAHEFTDGAIGPVALDHTGQRVVYAVADGVLVVRDTGSEAELLRHHSGLPEVDELAMAPDGSAVVAVCGTTACVLTFDGDRIAASRIVEPVCDLAGQVRVATRVTWGEHGLRVFVTGEGSAVFDGDGRVLWREPVGVRGAFSPDGRVLVTATPGGDGAVEAWFLDALR
ncbi:WD40 repeat domain-containing protein [Lentzea tibetensis]|uniref:WD40 repeat domain-containing protein n=1 Tax=Lentzea tibetensis TaxID=2591470 RepID=A0A563EIK0_9PSEU|nr:WD40 repeat domain-containing protein [Lentzea tibetensis]TWP45744.1 WD40 repeat domain-containing protein [Lentzea tibetensis]